MGKSAIKEKVIRKIEKIDNKQYLEALYNFIEASEPHEVYKLSPAQKKAINKSLEQIKKGQVVPHEEVVKRMDKWLKEK